MDGRGGLRVDGTQLVHGLADHIDDPTQNFASHRYRDGLAGVLDSQAARESIRCVHRDAADGVFPEVHRNFNNQVVFLIIDEGMGSLDTEFLHGMQLMFDLLKSQFDFVIVISHLDNIRDMVDNILEIRSTNGYSHINIVS